MAVGAILATALKGIGTPPKGLYLDGLDVVKRPGGSGMGTPIDTVRVTEAGPGGVSSMEFVIDDPALAVAVTDGMEVRFQDHTLDYPIFLGWVQSYSVRPAFGDTGRQIAVTAVGAEAVIDWAVLANDITFPAFSGTTFAAIAQRIVGNAIGLGPIRAGSLTGVFEGNQAFPILDSGWFIPSTITIKAGTTVREALRMMISQAAAAGWLPVVTTVDFYYGLRAFTESSRPGDYATLVLTNVFASASNSETLNYDVDTAGVIRGVMVRGTGVTVIVVDGSGRMGPIAVLDDTTVTTAAMATAAGVAYLNAFRSGLRGRFGQSDRAGSAVIHAGGFVQITDARVGLAAEFLRIMRIGRTFNPSGRENWVVDFGGLPPSGAALIRHLTRDTLS